MSSDISDRAITGGAKAEAASPSGIARRLLRLMAPYRLRLAVSVAAGIGAAFLAALPPLAVGWAAAALIAEPADPSRLAALAILAFAALVGRHLLFAVSTGLSHLVAFAVQRDLRLRLAAALRAAPTGFVEAQPKGALRTCLIDDVEQIEDGMAHLVPEATAAVVAPLAVLAVLSALDWRLSLLATLPIAAGLVLTTRLMGRGQEATNAYLDAQRAMAEAIAEIADALPTVRTYNQDGAAVARAEGRFADLTRITRDWLRRAVVPAATAQVVLTGHLLVAAPAGLLLAASGRLPLGTLVTFVAVLASLGDVFASLHGLSHRLVRQVEHLDRIDALLAAPRLAVTAEPETPSGTDLRFEAVSFGYGGRRVLHEIDLAIPAGRCVALVGPTGSGKSTLARLVSRFHDVEAGRITLGGVDLRRMRPDALHGLVSVVFQDVFLFSGTVADNIRLGRPRATDAEVEAAARRARIHHVVASLPDGYGTNLGEAGAGLSGGERQRLSIARALLKDAPILVLDEATSFADPETEALVQEALADLTRDRTVIVVAHRLQTVAGADEIVVLDGGRIVETGPHERLLARAGLYARLVAAQTETERGAETPSCA